MEEHEMPIRPDGVRADMIIDPGPVFHRMNIGQVFEQYMTAAAYDVTLRVAHRLGLIESMHATDFQNRSQITQDVVLGINTDVFAEAYDYLMQFYRVFNNVMPDYFSNLNRVDQAEHICDIINDGCCRIFLPVDNIRLPKDIVKDIERLFQPTFTTIKYVDQSKQLIETHEKVLIGPVYMFILDKPASEWSATSMARIQHFGVLSSVTKSEKFAYPYRNSPVRLLGETESRIFACYTGAETIAEMFDRTSNPITRRNLYMRILEAEIPSRIDCIVDREIIPLGASRPIQIVNHIFMCCGFKPQYLPEIVNEIRETVANVNKTDD